MKNNILTNFQNNKKNKMRYPYYFFIEEKNEYTELEKLVKDFLLKIELFEKQFDLTIKLYISEYNNELNKFNEDFRFIEKKRKEIYDQAYDELKGDEADEYRDSYADQMSGLSTFDYESNMEKDYLKKRFLDFLDQYSKTVLIQLYSLIENKLKEICDILSIDFYKKIKYEHLDSRNYLDTSINYLKLVIEIPTDSLESYITKLKDIQFIRNKVIHDEAKFSNEKKAQIRKIVRENEEVMELLELNSNLFLRIRKKKYILDLFVLIKEFFEEVIWLIDSKQEYIIFKKGLKHWFGVIANNICIKNFKVTKALKSKKNIEFEIEFKKLNNLKYKYKCRMSIKQSKKNSLEITDQTENEYIENFANYGNEKDDYLFVNVFELFNLSKKGLEVILTIF